MRSLKFLIPVFLLLSQVCFSQSNWEIKAENIDPNNYFGVTTANGIIGLVSSPEPMKVGAVVLNGTYDNYERGRVSNILKTFNHINLEMDVDGHRIGPSATSDYKQILDMKKAQLVTTFKAFDVEVEHKVMALRHLPYSALVVVKVKAKKDLTITPYSVIQAPNHLQDVRNFFWHVDRPHVTIPLLSSVAKSPTGKIKVAATNTFMFNEDHHDQPPMIHEDWDFNRHWMKFHKKLKKGETYEFSLVATTCSSEQFSDPQNEADRLTVFASQEGKDRLLNAHEREWKKLWESDIIIEGDDQAQKDVRFALYHLYSFAREGTAYSLSPMGLSGLGYNGHVFWDTELWMFPPLLMMQPEIARSLLEYRYERLEAARQNAFSHGYKGALFPWESADDGAEETPVWAITGPFEHHIAADIAWAHWKYYQVTKDKKWLEERGYPVIMEVADFWTSRVDRNGPGQYDIINVIGANEWLENIDNNAFTNGMAITSLRYATKAAVELGIEPNPDWAHVADNIPIIKFEDGTTRENSTYQGEMIKQADVNLLSFPVDFITDEVQMKKDLDYYETKISPTGPAMGFSVLSALHSRIGDQEKAYKWFLKSFEPNKAPPFGVLAENAGGSNPYFATGAGGMLQAVLGGFGGLEITDEGIIQKYGKLPKQWKSITIIGVGKEKKTFEIK